MIPYNQIETLREPTLHCGKCGTALFRLPPDVRKGERIQITILRSEPIGTQPKPDSEILAACGSCGVRFPEIGEPFLILKEGAV